jgi:hypothetical protein
VHLDHHLPFLVSSSSTSSTSSVFFFFFFPFPFPFLLVYAAPCARRKLLLCDTCPLAFHMCCLAEPLTQEPSGRLDYPPVGATTTSSSIGIAGERD